MQLRFPAILAAAAALASIARGSESNAWPLSVRRVDPADGAVATEAIGPLFGSRHDPAGSSLLFARPFLLRESTPELDRTLFLYPLFTWERRPDAERFSFFQLVNRQHQTTAEGTGVRGFDVWPFYFSRDTGTADTSYRALLPFAGTIKHRFGRDRIEWTAFPFHLETLKAGRRVTHTPWPIVRRYAGDGHTGFELWPLYGERARAGDYRHRFWLWPLAFDSSTNLGAPQPDRKTGALPFHSRSSGPGYVSEDYLWPFFGYTRRTEPAAYDERRYFWPLLVQGRGARHVNRWAPLYTHSIAQGVDKHWLLWPLWRTATWEADGVAQRKDQFLFFIWWSLEQRSLANPAAAPASKRHLWPLVSTWDNGAGRRQVQLLSPLEVFFPHHEPVRQLWSPLFALARYDRRGDDEQRWSFLWNAVTARRGAGGAEFHLGPLLGSRRDAGGREVTLGNGLLRWSRGAGEARWRFSFLAPRPAAAAGRTSASPP